ncbi:hypothetical protein VP01_2255g1 [Puccinia sorghi]|uniref:Uncharacterized protein n=1 Tax=Puccinia sorghi TaxID=27349 RepID=A0A0L6V8K1_9BASI|nr:hypothetical protein VP01_2255g1 [Puccinia sorghi]
MKKNNLSCYKKKRKTESSEKKSNMFICKYWPHLSCSNSCASSFCIEGFIKITKVPLCTTYDTFYIQSPAVLEVVSLNSLICLNLSLRFSIGRILLKLRFNCYFVGLWQSPRRFYVRGETIHIHDLVHGFRQASSAAIANNSTHSSLQHKHKNRARLDKRTWRMNVSGEFDKEEGRKKRNNYTWLSLLKNIFKMRIKNKEMYKTERNRSLYKHDIEMNLIFLAWIGFDNLEREGEREISSQEKKKWENTATAQHQVIQQTHWIADFFFFEVSEFDFFLPPGEMGMKWKLDACAGLGQLGLRTCLSSGDVASQGKIKLGFVSPKPGVYSYFNPSFSQDKNLKLSKLPNNAHKPNLFISEDSPSFYTHVKDMRCGIVVLCA